MGAAHALHLRPIPHFVERLAGEIAEQALMLVEVHARNHQAVPQHGELGPQHAAGGVVHRRRRRRLRPARLADLEPPSLPGPRPRPPYPPPPPLRPPPDAPTP